MRTILALGLDGACFVIASITALIGVTLGIYMVISEDHTLMPVHAHLNLIGWVGICLFGLYYRAHPASIGRLAWVQAGAVAIGCAAMLSSLATILLTGSKSAYAIAFAGTFAIWLGMALFVVIVVRDRLDAIAVNMLPNLSETASGAGRSPR